MKYKFVAAYCVYGLTMRLDQNEVTLYRDDRMHVFLTTDVTGPLEIVDRQAAIGRTMLGKIWGLAIDGDSQDAWRPIVKRTLDSRHERYKGLGFLTIEVEGDIDVTLPEQCEKIDDYRVCFDAYDKRALAECIQPNVARALAAVRLGGDMEYEFEQVMSGSYLVDNDGLVVHSISTTIQGMRATISQSASDDKISEMRTLIPPLLQSSELTQSIDLLAQSLNRQETKLRAFMAAWNALEQFVKETRTTYGPCWDAERANSHTPQDRIILLDSIPNNGSKVARAFGKMACYLGGANILMDIDEFMTLKDVRNNLSHELRDDELPVDRVQRLMDKYVKTHLRYVQIQLEHIHKPEVQ